MRLQVKNLGPIKKGEIDLDKRFYVFVGYNNSGKTYMSQVMSTLWRGSFALGYTKSNERSVSINGISSIEITDEIVNKVHTEIQSILVEQVKVNFRSNNKQFSNLEISFVDFKEFVKSFDFKFYIDNSFGLEDKYFYISKKKGSLNLTIELKQQSLFSAIGVDDDFEIVEILTEIFKQELFMDLCFRKGRPYFLPANRLFLANFYKYLFAIENQELIKVKEALSKRKTIDEIKGISENSYTADISYLLTEIYTLSLSRQENDYYQDLLDELKDVIGGDIVSKASNRDISSLTTFKLKIEDAEELDLHLSSSSVNQLITLYLYFKYWANEEGNTLIIDEPEENLHPKNQLALLNILMKFANRNNNRVIITTHSPLMSDAVNNHLHLGYLAEKYEKNVAEIIKEHEIDIDADAAMKHQDIGIYFFDGKSIKEYSVEEYGVDFKDFRKEQEKVEAIGDKLRGLIYENQQKEYFQTKEKVV